MIRTPAEKPRTQFRKDCHKGYAKNAELNPAVPEELAHITEPAEGFIVKVSAFADIAYWFSDRRVVVQLPHEFNELTRYTAIRRVHWMFSDLRDRLTEAFERSGGEGISQIKQAHFDRIELETDSGIVVPEGLGQSYVPALNFFGWLNR